MRDEVAVVHHAVETVHSRPHELRHRRVADAWTPEVVDVHWHAELLTQPQSSNLRQRCSHAVPSRQDPRRRVLLEQFCNLGIDFGLNDAVVLIEAGMHLTSLAVIGDHFDVEVLDPVLCVGGSSEGDDDEVMGAEVSDVAGGQCDVVADVAHLHQVELHARLARPAVQALLGTVGQARQVCVVRRVLHVIGQGAPLEAEAEGRSCQQEKEEDECCGIIDHDIIVRTNGWMNE